MSSHVYQIDGSICSPDGRYLEYLADFLHVIESIVKEVECVGSLRKVK